MFQLETAVKGFMNDTLQFYDGPVANASLVRAFWDQMMKDVNKFGDHLLCLLFVHYGFRINVAASVIQQQTIS